MRKQKDFCEILGNNNVGLIQLWLKKKQVILKLSHGNESYILTMKEEKFNFHHCKPFNSI